MNPVPAASSAAAPPEAGGATVACAWCARPCDAGCERLVGRVRCPGCGAATTDPAPSDADLEAAYGAWYRPDGGRFSGPATRCSRRSRGPPRAAPRPVAPDGPVLDVGAGDGALLDALAARGRERGRARARPSRPDVRSGEVREIERTRGRRSSSGTRSSTCATPGRRSTTPRRLLDPDGHPGDRDAQPRQPPGAARSATAGSASTSRATSSTCRRRRCVARLREPRARDRAREPPARRPGGVRLAARPGRLAARAPGPLRRDPPPRGAPRAERSAARPAAAALGGRGRPAAGRRGAARSSRPRCARGGGTVYVEARRG